jgi:hypothetical protein
VGSEQDPLPGSTSVAARRGGGPCRGRPSERGDVSRSSQVASRQRAGDLPAAKRSITVPDAIRPAPPPGGIGGEDEGRRPSRYHESLRVPCKPWPWDALRTCANVVARRPFHRGTGTLPHSSDESCRSTATSARSFLVVDCSRPWSCDLSSISEDRLTTRAEMPSSSLTSSPKKPVGHAPRPSTSGVYTTPPSCPGRERRDPDNAPLSRARCTRPRRAVRGVSSRHRRAGRHYVRSRPATLRRRCPHVSG